MLRDFDVEVRFGDLGYTLPARVLHEMMGKIIVLASHELSKASEPGTDFIKARQKQLQFHNEAMEIVGLLEEASTEIGEEEE
jgi:hypothetical protein